jgi:hypothetical protein
MPALDFEVHIGLSRVKNQKDFVSIPKKWKSLRVLSVLPLKSARQYEMHNVDGPLLTLLTRHAKDIHQVQNWVSEATAYLANDQTSRVEVEQVLASSGEDLQFGPLSEFSFAPLQSTFPGLKLIEEAPPYEAHYCLKNISQTRVASIEEVKSVCEDAHVGIDEIVQFEGGKITTTKFYGTLRQMSSQILDDSRKFLGALARARLDVKFRIVAERIIVCGIPQFLEERL